MFPEVTSVYVPVKTPDYKKWAILLSALVHAAILGAVIYFHHKAPPAPMETSIVTPEQLAEIEGQIRANQQNNAAVSGDMAGAKSTLSDIIQKATNHSPPHTTPQTDTHTQQVMNEIAAKEAQWQKEQAQFAEQIDQEIAAENQQVIEQLNAEQAELQAKLSEYKNAEDSQDERRQQLIEEMEASQKALDAKREQLKKSQATPNVDLGKDGDSTAGTGQSQATVGGNGAPRKGGNTGGNAAGYISQIKGIIDSHWSPPANSQGKSLTVSFNISPTGAISNISVKGGGDEAFKRSLEQALQASNPLPAPPEAIYSKVDSNNFTFTAD